MTTNAQIQRAFADAIIAAALGYPLSFPGVNFTPPDSGIWLEVSFLPNTGIDDRLAYDGEVVPQGIIQVMAVMRPGEGIASLTAAAESVINAFPSGTYLSSPVRVVRKPYQGSAIQEGDRLMIPVTIEYFQ